VAAVVVSIVHLCKGRHNGEKQLDSQPVPQITAFLFDKGGHEDPKRLTGNAAKSFVGSIVLGMGFTFDDSGEADDVTPGIPSPIATMERLIAANPKSAEVIFPYIGGKEVNDSPTHAHRRYVIDFRDRSEEACRQEWPELMELLDKKVKPERTRTKANGEFALRAPLPQRWWQHADKRPALYSAIAEKSRVLAVSQTSKYKGFVFLSRHLVIDQKLIAFPSDSYGEFTCLQSSLHLNWALFFGGTLEDRPVYTPSDCFETFPFPACLLESNDTDAAHGAQRQILENIGEYYHQRRAELMIANEEGLTSTYNRLYAFRGRDAPAQDCTSDGPSLSDQAAVLCLAELRAPAAVTASPHRGDGQSRPAPGTARHRGPVA
jgi:hypothetical protein